MVFNVVQGIMKLQQSRDAHVEAHVDKHILPDVIEVKIPGDAGVEGHLDLLHIPREGVLTLSIRPHKALMDLFASVTVADCPWLTMAQWVRIGRVAATFVALDVGEEIGRGHGFSAVPIRLPAMAMAVPEGKPPVTRLATGSALPIW
jgi:hypothetical protein